MLAGTPLIDVRVKLEITALETAYSLSVANPELHRDRRRCSFCELRAAVGRDRRQDLVTRTVGASPHWSVGHGFYAGIDKADGVIG